MSAARSVWPVLRTLALAGLLAGPLVGGALAQPVSGALEVCTRITDRAERLDCYDRVAGSGVPADQSGSRGDSVAVPPAGDADVDVEAAAEAEAEAEAEVEAEADADAPAAVEVESEADAEAPAAVEVAVEDLPRSRVERRARSSDEERAARSSILVVQRVENLSGLSVFVAEDGTVYDQVSPRQGRYPDLPFIADLESASRNSYWLRTEARGRAIRVVVRD